MRQSLGARAVQYALVLAATLLINFMLPRIAPGSPLQLLAGSEIGHLTADEIAAITEAYGLDDSLWEQFFTYLGNLARGDFGFSYRLGEPVISVLWERIPWTLLLAGTGLVIATILGVVLGSYAALRRNRLPDATITGSAAMIQSIPTFFTGLLFLAVFGAQLGWFPTFGAHDMIPPEGLWERVTDLIDHLIMPATVLVMATYPATLLTTRYAMVDLVEEGFIGTAYSKGLGESTILFRHGLRNAILPVLTVFALQLGYLISGTVVIETVFSYPGVGHLMFEAVLGRDYPVLQAGFLLITVSVIAANLLADISYQFLDPRVRYDAARSTH